MKQALQCEADPMELLAFSPSDDYTTDSVEDMDVAATGSGEDMDVAPSADENTSTTDNGTACSALYSNSGSSGVVAAVDGGQDSVSFLEYENAAGGTGPFSISGVAIQNKVQYISVGNYDTEEMAERSLDQLNHFVYNYKTQYVSMFQVGKEFECRSHKGCHHRIKLTTHQAGETGNKFQILQKGEHAGTVVNLTTKGISPILKPEVDALLKLDMTAGLVKNMLLLKYLRDTTMLALVPETKKMDNRNAYLKRLAGDGWEISKFVALTNGTAGKLSQSRGEFYRVDETNGADMNELIVLDEFEHLVTVEVVSVASLGVVVTTRALFCNVEHAVHDQGDSLVLSTDGTYSIDHADAIASALELVWPHIEILFCWEHFLRQSRKQTKLEKTKGFMKDIGEQHLRRLHQSRSLKQIRALSKRVVKAWKEAGEDKLAGWHQNVYLTNSWERWSVNSSSVPGFPPA
ncbi:hypothetical protein L917_12612 [Phytophthora nicotianae]|uniref:MULE transposase domain-containing protein n=3 Tax=Phytophthora nicotianae TaxID=4792 RepID=W2KUP8_PHYNI|nr:hypothetical protein L917_12612 [Phytophthora nicotianae]